MANRYYNAVPQGTDSTATSLPGAQLFFYINGTTTPQNTYSDPDLTSANANPVVADGNGRFGDIFLLPAAYTVVLKDADDVQQWSRDDVNGDAPPIVVDSYTKLRALTGMTTGTLARVSAGTGIDGLFRYDSAQVATDNGGTIIVGWVRVYDGPLQLSWFATGDGVTDEGAILTTVKNAGDLQVEGEPGKTYLSSSELTLDVANMTWDWKGSTLKAHPDLPNTDNIIEVTATNVVIKNGTIDGNKANLNQSFTSGTTGNGILFYDGSSGGRAIEMYVHDTPTNGIANVANGTNDVLIDRCVVEDCDFTGAGVEYRTAGSTPPTNFRIANTILRRNNAGGDLRIAGCTDFFISGVIVEDAGNNAAVFYVGDAKTATKGRVVNSRFQTTNAAVNTCDIEAQVQTGALTGQNDTLEVDMVNVDLEGDGGGTILRLQNGAILRGANIRGQNGAIGFFPDGQSYYDLKNVKMRQVTDRPYILGSAGYIDGLISEVWAAGKGGLDFGSGGTGSVIRNARIGAVIDYSGTHDGANNASILTDSSQSWVVNELVGKQVRNTTDGSRGAITANTATTVTASLAGGTDNDWDTSDAYQITDETGQHGVTEAGAPTNLYIEVRSFTGYGNKFNVTAAEETTWTLVDEGLTRHLRLVDGVTAPTATSGEGHIFINASTGNCAANMGTVGPVTFARDDGYSNVFTQGTSAGPDLDGDDYYVLQYGDSTVINVKKANI